MATPTTMRRRPRARRTQRAKGRGWTPGDGLIAAVVALAFFGMALGLMGHVTQRLNPITGDEPFYLVTAGSILHDGDIDEANNWLARDVDAWLPPDPLPAGWQGWPILARGFPPHASATIRDGLYSKHGLGVPVLIVGPMALGGRTGVVVLYAAIGALIAANIYLLARACGAGALMATAITGALVLASPLLSYSFLIFPELPAALCIIYAFRRLLLPHNTWWQALLVGLAIALVPWLHARLALVAVALGVMALVRLGQRRTSFPLVPLLGPAALSAVGLVAFYWYFYGRPWPNTQDHAGLTTSPVNWSAGLIGLLLDQQWGLLIHAPIYLLVAAGVVALARGRPDILLWLAAVTLPYYALIGAYNQWWGEWCPPARYLAPIAPLAAAPIAALWSRDRTAITGVLVALLSLPGIAIMAIFLAQPRLMYNHPNGRSELLVAIQERLFGIPEPTHDAVAGFVEAFPSFVVPEATSPTLRLWWILGLAALVVLTTIATYEKDGPAAGQPYPRWRS